VNTGLDTRQVVDVCLGTLPGRDHKSEERNTRLRKVSHAGDPSVLASAIGCFSPGEDSPDEALFGVQVESIQSSRTEAFPTN